MRAPGTTASAAGWVSFGVTAAAMVATPLLRQGGRGRRTLTSVVVGGLWATTLSRSAHRWGTARSVSTAGVLAVATGAVEKIGTVTGLPFGPYRYTGRLRPQVGGVPAIVPMAWFAMAVPARDTAHAALGTRSTPVGRVLLGAAALTAWDLFLDPQMVGEGCWTWQRGGRYRGVPVSNYVGWFLTGLAVMALLERALPPQDPDPGLMGEYAFMAVMEAVGFAVFFGDPLVAAVGAAGMLPPALAAARALGRVSPPGGAA